MESSLADPSYPNTLKLQSKQEVTAPILSQLSPKPLPLSQIDPYVYDFSLKSINGIFEDNFLFINQSEKGEIIGAYTSEEKQQESDVTLKIDGIADLEVKHAEIKFTDSFEYQLKDLSTQAGTWIKVNSDVILNPLLLKTPKKNVEFMLNNYRIKFGLEKDYKITLKEWLKKYDLQNYERNFIELGIYSVKELIERQLPHSLRQSLQSQDIKKIKKACSSTRSLSKDNYKLTMTAGQEFHHLSTYEITDDKVFKIGNSIQCDLKLDINHGRDMHSQGFASPSQVQCLIEYSIHYDKRLNSFVFQNKSQPNNQDKEKLIGIGDRPSCQDSSHWLFRRLVPQEKCFLVPGEIIKLSSLLFQVQRFNVGAVGDIGNRHSMEDRHVVIQDLRISEEIYLSYFGVYDGHEGEYCAEYLQENLHRVFKDLLINKMKVQSCTDVNMAIHDALNESFIQTDLNFYNEKKPKAEFSGSTAVVVIIAGAKVFCANVGDSRAVLCRNGKAVNLSMDHKASREDEHQRILKANGKVMYQRVDGTLAISRSMGDFQYKPIGKPSPTVEDIKLNAVISIPEIRYTELDPNDDDFILLASDGLYDKFTSQQAVDFIMEKYSSMTYMEQNPKATAIELVREAVFKRFSHDNTTAVIINLNRGVNRENFGSHSYL